MVKMSHCKCCGNKIAKDAVCPRCGKNNAGFLKRNDMVTVVTAIFILGATVSINGMQSSSRIENNDVVQQIQNDNQTQDNSLIANLINKQESRNFKVGDKFKKKDSYTIEVTRFYEYESDNIFLKAKPGMKIVAAEVIIHNIDEDKDLSVTALDFNMLNLDGEQYDMTLTDIENDLNGDIAPGRRLKGSVAFEIPENINEVELQVDLTFGNMQSIYFKGNIE